MRICFNQVSVWVGMWRIVLVVKMKQSRPLWVTVDPRPEKCRELREHKQESEHTCAHFCLRQTADVMWPDQLSPDAATLTAPPRTVTWNCKVKATPSPLDWLFSGFFVITTVEIKLERLCKNQCTVDPGSYLQLWLQRSMKNCSADDGSSQETST